MGVELAGPVDQPVVTAVAQQRVAPAAAAELAASLGITTADIRQVALVDMLFFFGVLLVGFAYLWRFGYLDWVRSAATTSIRADYRPGFDLSREARRPPDLVSPRLQSVICIFYR